MNETHGHGQRGSGRSLPVGRATLLALGVPFVLGVAFLIAPSGRVVVPVSLPSGRVIRAEVAQTALARARGLMFRPSMGEDEGMLLSFPTAGRHAIWTKGCRFAIDVVWLNDKHRVVDIAASVPPCRQVPCPVFRSAGVTSFALELNARVGGQHITDGSTLSFTLPPELQAISRSPSDDGSSAPVRGRPTSTRLRK